MPFNVRQHPIRLLEHFTYDCHIVRVLRRPKEGLMSVRNLLRVNMKCRDTLFDRGERLILFHILVEVGILDERVHELDGFKRFLKIPRRVEDAKLNCADFLNGNTIKPIADVPAVGTIAKYLEEVFKRICRKCSLHHVRSRGRGKIFCVPPFRKVENLFTGTAV